MRTTAHPLHTPLCDLLEIEVGIMQAGMGRAQGSPTTPALVAAVSEAGGLGCLGASGLDPDGIRGAIGEIKALTARPFAVDLLLPASLAEGDHSRTELRALIEQQYPEHWSFVQSLHDRYDLDPVEVEREHTLTPSAIDAQIEAVLEAGTPVLVAGLGDPASAVERAHARGTRVMGIAGSARHAERQRAAGVDAVIAQGYEAGGHTGTVASFVLIPEVVDRVAPLPVIGAGGIADGRGVAAALALGAQAAWCGTAFLFAIEADITDTYRSQLTEARSHDLVVSRTYTGKPSRIVRNPVLDAWSESGLDPLPMPYQHVLMDDLVAAAERGGHPELVNHPAGQAAGIIREHEPAAEIVRRMAEVTAATIDRLADQASSAAS